MTFLPSLISYVQYVIAYPISKGKMVNFVAFKSHHDLENTRFNGPWVCATDSAEFAATFRTWEPEVQALVDVRLYIYILPSVIQLAQQFQCVERPLRWAIHTVKPLKSFVSGRAGLIGDAVRSPFTLFFNLPTYPTGTRHDSTSRFWGRPGHRGKYPLNVA